MALALTAALLATAWLSFALRGRRGASIPLLAGWTLWALAALGSVVNTLE